MAISAKNNAAFQILDKAHEDFARAPVAEAFNWDEFAKATDLEEWYLVVFRSVRKETADVAQLIELEDLAHMDAAGQPRFLFYFAGKVSPGANHLRNMSFCMWGDRESAKTASRRTPHTNASAVARDAYDEYKLERYNARISRVDGRARVEFEALI